MIYIIESRGQIGNQLFQYLFIKKIMGSSDYLILIGFESLQRLIQLNGKILVLKKPPLIYRINRLIKEKLSIAILSSINQKVIEISNISMHSDSPVFTDGIIKNIVVVEGFFQAYNLIESKYQPKFKSFNIITDIGCKSKLLCFIHLRKGDYADFKYNDVSVELDISYYKRAIMHMIKMEPMVHFVICSNENLRYVDELFWGIENNFTILKDQGPEYTFNFMRNCNYGIISNSTFSWLAGYFSTKNNPKALIIAPKNHLGHNFGIEIPLGIKNPAFIYI